MIEREPSNLGLRAARAAGAGIFGLSAFLVGCGNQGPDASQVFAPGTEDNTDTTSPETTNFSTDPDPSTTEGSFSSEPDCPSDVDVANMILAPNSDYERNAELIYGGSACASTDGISFELEMALQGIAYEKQDDVLAASGNTREIFGMDEDGVVRESAKICVAIMLDEGFTEPTTAFHYWATKYPDVEENHGKDAFKPLFSAAEVTCGDIAEIPSYASWDSVQEWTPSELSD